MRDFNINLLNLETHHPTDDFINTLGSYFFLPQILQPTGVTHHTANLIKNIFFNSLEHHSVSGKTVHDLTDHPQTFGLSINFHIDQQRLKSSNDTALVDEIRSIDKCTILPCCHDVNVLFTSFYSKLSNIVDKHVLLKKLEKKEIKFMSKPWITPAVKVSIDVKNTSYKNYLKTRSLYLYSRLKCYRNKLNRLHRDSVKECIIIIFSIKTPVI